MAVPKSQIYLPRELCAGLVGFLAPNSTYFTPIAGRKMDFCPMQKHKVEVLLKLHHSPTVSCSST